MKQASYDDHIRSNHPELVQRNVDPGAFLKKVKSPPVIASVAIVVIAVLLVSIYQSGVESGTIPGVRPGFQAERFTLSTPDGTPVSLGKLIDDDKPILLEFFATSCGHCGVYTGPLGQLHENYSSRLNMVSVAINWNNNDGSYTPPSAESIDGWTSEHGSEWTHVISDRSTRDTYKIQSTPTTLWIRDDGVIHKRETGSMSYALLESRTLEIL